MPRATLDEGGDGEWGRSLRYILVKGGWKWPVEEGEKEGADNGGGRG